jgi:two-component system sensor histidine kinase DesK
MKERMRISRDLHDLLGYSLSAITLKAEFSARLVGSNPARAREELAELLDVTRQALTHVRTAASERVPPDPAGQGSAFGLLAAGHGAPADDHYRPRRHYWPRRPSIRSRIRSA